MDIKYMKRAIEISKKGAGFTNPNPLVGAVIVKDDQIIGEGYHEKYGDHHAEVNAFNNATASVEGATMYVTLEPCSHYGNTPPCAKAIVEKKIKKVIVGMVDPNPLVAGRGIKMMRDAGIEVKTGVLSDEVKKVNEIFLKYIQDNRPYCIMKTAMTLDGKIATKTGDSKWISNTSSRRFSHEIRNRVSGILVGINTVLNDDPRLTTRLDRRSTDPIRIILDSKARIPLDAKVLTVASDSGVIVATTEKANDEKIEKLKSLGVEIIKTPLKDNRVDLDYLINTLGERSIDSLLIEGGGTVNFSFLKERLVDKIYSFIAPKIIGGREALTPVEGDGFDTIDEGIELKDVSVQDYYGDVLIEAYVKKE
jgi:diaminohydroxyphosphoribosylaminopyrimidine deaminase/5-amino-6-(5-phosphoribosylamino)uracil reductase